jgi:hypothetical protein
LVCALSVVACQSTQPDASKRARARKKRRYRPATSGRAVKKDPCSDQSFASLRPQPREPGPPRDESDADLKRTEREVSGFIGKLLKSDFSRRELTAMADIRGYRHYRNRRFKQAYIWFFHASFVDPKFELSHYNAARCAALIGRCDWVFEHLARLRSLGTPLSRARLALANCDPELFGKRGPKRWLDQSPVCLKEPPQTPRKGPR